MTSGIRPPLEADIPAVVRMISEHAPEAFDEATLRQEWTSPRIDLERDARMDETAYVLVETLGEARVWIDLHGRPPDELLDWGEARAAELGTRLLSGAWAKNRPVLDVLERRGYRPVRHSNRMAIDLSEPTPQPTWPPGIGVRTLEPGDERTFYEVYEETFEDSWEPVEESYEEWAHWLLAPPSLVPDLWFLARENGVAAGIAICHPHPSRPDLGWIKILGVRRQWRRRGLGRGLLLHAFSEFRRRGLAHAGLGVDSESPTGAHDLYRGAGMHPVARFDIYEKALG